MADTTRTLSAILALFADNSSGNISAQDLRDFVVSVNPGYGGFYITSSSETSISAVDTWTKAAGTTAALDLANFTHSTGRLTYTGTSDIEIVARAQMSVTSAGNSKTYKFGISKNGTVLPASILSRKIGTGADVGALGVQAEAQLSTNDYIEVVVQNTTDATNCTLEYGSIIVQGELI